MKKRTFILAATVGFGVLALLFAGRSGPRIVQRNALVPETLATVDLMEIRARSGIRAFDRGFRTTSEVRFPRLPQTNAFWSAINEDLERRARESGQVFTDQVTWPLFRAGLGRSNDAFDWRQEIVWEARWISPRLVSVLATHIEYTGGAHGNTVFESLNAVPDDHNSWKGVTLGEFFTSTSGWRKPVATHVAAEINRRKRENWGVDFDESIAVSVTPDDLEATAFTVGQKGFTLWFAPYSKGSYAEGSFEAFIPYREVLHLLDTNGPARWLPCFQYLP